jgi:4-amino-4-deoxy-L-arabinose transferase-like glycosyltransferase
MPAACPTATRLTLPFGWFLLLVAAYLLPGLIGHDPWKQDETYIFDILYGMLHSHDWVLPRLAGEPFMEKPPLYYWLGAALAHRFSPWLPLHDGARLASGVFMAITFVAVGSSARLGWGEGYGRRAVLVLIASFGLVYESHIMITDVPMMAGFAVALYGLLSCRERPLRGGVWLGLGSGIGFLAKGLLVPGTLGVTAVLLPVLFAPWRTRAYARSLALATVAALPLLLIWPTALYLRDPHQFYVWFWLNNVGRYLGFSVPVLGASNEPGLWLKTLPWFAFPALYLALASVWLHRRELSQHVALQVGLVSFGVYFAVLQSAASERTSYGLPLLVALALLAAPQTATLSAAWNRRLDCGARLLFGAIAMLLWGIWASMIATGHAPPWNALTRVLPADFVMPLQALPLTAAGLATWLWLALWRRLPSLRERAIVSLAAGLTLCWLLVATLWLPWLDVAKTYRGVFTAMQIHLPLTRRCVESVNLGESERAMLDYFLGLRTARRELHLHPNCDVLLVEAASAPDLATLGSVWRPLWTGERAGDLHEHFWLYARRDAPAQAAR